jgi:hypothetical protein
VADPAALGRLFDDRRVLASDAAEQPAQLQAYLRASDLPALVDAHGLHAAPSRLPRTVLLWAVTDPLPFPDGAAAVLRHALDLLELAGGGRIVDTPQPYAAWQLIEQHAAQDVPSWYRATRTAARRLGQQARRHRAQARGCTRHSGNLSPQLDRWSWYRRRSTTSAISRRDTESSYESRRLQLLVARSLHPTHPSARPSLSDFAIASAALTTSAS